MNYPEELRERYNEVMYDERSIVEKFLKDQYDIRYGRQRDTWHFEPAVRLINTYGVEVAVTDIRLDKSDFVLFTGVCCSEKHNDYKCYEFAYGELSKVIEALPDADEIVKKNALADLKKLQSNLRIDLILSESPFIYNTDKKMLWSEFAKGNEFNFDKLGETYGTDFLSKLRDHINIEVLHRSNEYKGLMELLSLEENMRFECQNYGDATFVIDGTDVTFDVSSVRRSDKGCLVIYGNDIDADVCDSIELTEKDIKHEYLVGIINEMKRSKYIDIMDTHNGHNEELVRKINSAWKDAKYHNSFSEILLALLVRDHEEYIDKYCEIEDYSGDWAMAHAHEIIEGVCDDQDLETILLFIRYEE